MQNIWKNLNTNTELVITVNGSNGLPFNPTAVNITIYANGSDTPALISTMTQKNGISGLYKYMWDISSLSANNYVIVYSYEYLGNTILQSDTVQLIDMDYMGTGGSVAGYFNLTDINTGDALDGVVTWLQVITTVGAAQSCKKLTNAFGYVKFDVEIGTYYVYTEYYSTFVGTLVVSGTTPPVFTINPLLEV